MNRKLLLFLILISIVSMLAGTAAAPFESRSFHLVEVRFIDGKGVVFLFDTTGKFTKSDLDTAFAFAGGNSLDAHCVFNQDHDQIRCTVKLVNPYAGQSILVGLMGQGFWAIVPEEAARCLGFSYLFEGEGPYYGEYPSQEILDELFGGISLEEFIEVYIIGGAPPGVTFIDFCVTDPNLFGDELGDEPQ
mgnify:CR=1 FL=1